MQQTAFDVTDRETIPRSEQINHTKKDQPKRTNTQKKLIRSTFQPSNVDPHKSKASTKRATNAVEKPCYDCSFHFRRSIIVMSDKPSSGGPAYGSWPPEVVHSDRAPHFGKREPWHIFAVWTRLAFNSVLFIVIGFRWWLIAVEIFMCFRLFRFRYKFYFNRILINIHSINQDREKFFFTFVIYWGKSDIIKSILSRYLICTSIKYFRLVISKNTSETLSYSFKIFFWYRIQQISRSMNETLNPIHIKK